MTRESHQAKQAILILLSSLVLAGSLGGCVTPETYEKRFREYYDERVKVEEIDDGVYMIAASMDGLHAGAGRVHYLKENVIRKAREHCAQWNKALKVMNREGQDGSSSVMGFGGGGLLGGGISQAGAHFDIVFTCRERTKPAACRLLVPSREGYNQASC